MSIKAVNQASKLKLPPNEKLVLWCLCDHLNDDTGACYPSISRICDFTSLSRSTVLRCLKNLQTTHLTIEKGRGLSNNYVIDFGQNECEVVSHRHQCHTDTSVTQTPHQCHTDTPPVSHRHPTSVTQTPKPVINRLNKPVNKPIGEKEKIEVKKDTNKVKKIPTLEQVRKYAKEKGYTFNPDQFFYFWDAIDWTRKSGQKIKNWKSAMAQWALNQERYEAANNSKPKKRKSALDDM